MASHKAVKAPHVGWRRYRGRLVLAAGILLGLGTSLTWAYWTDTATVTSGTFTSGKLDLRIDDSTTTIGPGGTNDKTSLALTNMVPGDSIAAVVKAGNNNGVDLNYAVEARLGTGTFPAVVSPAVGLEMDLWAGGAATNTTNSTTGIRTGSCTGAVQRVGVTLTGTAKDMLLSARTLTSSASENLCVIVRLNIGADNGFQDKSGTVVLGFRAAQLGVTP